MTHRARHASWCGCCAAIRPSSISFPSIPSPEPATGARRWPVIQRFRDELIRGGVLATIRRTRGDDIDAACGQLAGRVIDRTTVRLGNKTIGLTVQHMKIAHALVIRRCASWRCSWSRRLRDHHTPHLAESHAQQDAAADNAQLAMAYMQEGNLPRAKEKLDKALQEDPANPNTHSVLALFYERINDQKKAESEFREALRLAPGDPGPLNFYGVYLCGQHRVDEGVTKMLQVARNPLYRTPEAAYTNAGVCLRHRAP